MPGAALIFYYTGRAQQPRFLQGLYNGSRRSQLLADKRSPERLGLAPTRGERFKRSSGLYFGYCRWSQQEGTTRTTGYARESAVPTPSVRHVSPLCSYIAVSVRCRAQAALLQSRQRYGGGLTRSAHTVRGSQGQPRRHCGSQGNETAVHGLTRSAAKLAPRAWSAPRPRAY